MRKRETKIIVPLCSVPTRCVIENSKKITKVLKSTIVASFQAKICWKRLWKRENKIIIPFHSYPTRDRKFQKNSKKIQKIERYHYGFISSFLVGKVQERVKIKIIVPFCFYPMHNGKFQKIAKQLKILKKYQYEFISSQNRMEKDGKERK